MKPILSRSIFASSLAIAALCAGCVEHSANYRRGDFSSRTALKGHYHGGNELNETDVLGVAVNQPTEEDIQKALDRTSKLDLKSGESLFVLQSGQSTPDPRMVNELNKHFRAMPYSGLKSDWLVGGDKEGADYAKALRLRAAQAGAEKILCFWGTLEISRHDLSTKTVTWLPVIDVVVPDQKDKVRVHLKMAAIDVRSGAWSIFRTEPVERDVVSTGWAREHLETQEVRELKEKSFVVAVNSLVTRASQ
jgi:hypothetical protein